jgi:hypothetical protein
VDRALIDAIQQGSDAEMAGDVPDHRKINTRCRAVNQGDDALLGENSDASG